MHDYSNSGHEQSLATSTSLLVRAREMNTQAWDQLAKLYTPLVYTWCRRRGLKPADAHDVVQEVFLAVSKSLPDFQNDKPGQSFRGWLKEISRCKIADHFRRVCKGADAIGGTNHMQVLDAVPFNSENGDVEASHEADQSLLMTTAINLIRTDFDETTWRAFEMLVLEGRTVSDVAEELGKSKEAIRQANYRVRKRLREEFDDLLA